MKDGSINRRKLLIIPIILLFVLSSCTSIMVKGEGEKGMSYGEPSIDRGEKEEEDERENMKGGFTDRSESRGAESGEEDGSFREEGSSQSAEGMDGGVSTQFDPLGEIIKEIDGNEADFSDFPVVRRIMIDPGHGGRDAGAVYGGVMEKDIALEIAKILRETILLRIKGVQVFLTREDDRYISLKDRAKMAKEVDADIFISIHLNSSPNSSTRGLETYYISNATDEGARRLEKIENASVDKEEESILSLILNDLKIEDKAKRSRPLALHVHKGVLSEMGEILPEDEYHDLGVKTALFYLLLECDMPAILIECGFLSNEKERENMKTVYFQQKIAKGIVSGIIEYIDSTKNVP